MRRALFGLGRGLAIGIWFTAVIGLAEITVSELLFRTAISCVGGFLMHTDSTVNQTLGVACF